MESTSKRKIYSGKEYDSLFPLSDNKDTTISSKAGVLDTIALIKKIIPETSKDTERLAFEVIEEDGLRKTLSNLWHFVYRHIPYQRDEESIEQVRRPARSWHDRNHPNRKGKPGVDCDCYSTFIGSVLYNLSIPFKFRITKYPQKDGEAPFWQHIYVVVPKDGDTQKELTEREDYIVMDCVKDAFDSEQPFLEHKDFTMRLDYLSGFEEPKSYKIPPSVDAADLVSTNGLDELAELGDWQQLESLDGRRNKSGGKEKRKGFFKKLAHGIKKLDPIAASLRNSVLLAMKVNLMKVASRLRYAYLTDEQAKAMGMDLNELAKIRKTKDKLEKIYEKAGGEKKNVRKAILKGKGNKDKRVPLSGLEGLDGFYGDADENRILSGIDLEGLEDIPGLENLSGFEVNPYTGEMGVLPAVAGGALALATSVVAPLAKALKSVKGLFKKKDSPGAQEFNSDSNAGSDSSGSDSNNNSGGSDNSNASADSSSEDPSDTPPGNKGAMSLTQEDSSPPASREEDTGVKQGFLSSALSWIKANPAVTILGAGIAGYGIYRLVKGKKDSVARSESTSKGLSGFSTSGRGKKKIRKKRKQQRHPSGSSKIIEVKLS